MLLRIQDSRRRAFVCTKETYGVPGCGELSFAWVRVIALAVFARRRGLPPSRRPHAAPEMIGTCLDARSRPCPPENEDPCLDFIAHCIIDHNAIPSHIRILRPASNHRDSRWICGNLRLQRFSTILGNLAESHGTNHRSSGRIFQDGQ